MQPENLVNGEFEPMVLRAFDAITRLFSWDEFTHRTGFEDYRVHALRKKYQQHCCDAPIASSNYDWPLIYPCNQPH
jgi:hypothetical protein